jgi:tetratricopeptide (TPR) repeat protein
LTYQARRAAFRRNYGKVEIVANELLELSPESEPFGRYFHALALSQQGKGNRDKANGIFKGLLDEDLPCIKAASLLALGASAVQVGDYELANNFRTKASQYNTNSVLIPILCDTLQTAIYSATKNYRSSLLTYERILPKLKSISKYYPAFANFELNNFAYDLFQFGEVDNAKQIISGVVASIYAPMYPEWQETADEIFVKKSSRPFVVVKKSNVLQFPIRNQVIKTGELIYRLDSQDYKLRDVRLDKVGALCDWLDVSDNLQSQRGDNQK